MYKLVILLLFTSISLTYSQDKEPSLWKFRWGHSNDLRTFDLDSFQQETIQNGFQWGGSTQMNNALFNTVRTGATLSNLTGSLNIPLNLIYQPVWKASSGYVPGYFGAVMMSYEPTLPLDGTNEGEILRPNDTTDPVFGFRYRRGTIATNTSDENYSRLVLKTADKSSYGGDRVLEDIWPQPRFETSEWKEKDGQTDNYLGRKWYFAINLRRHNPSTDLVKDDSVIIRIKIPYTRWDDASGYIKFNKLPINHQDSIIKLHFISDPDSASLYSFIDSRGYAQLMHIDTSETIEITRRMLPTSSDSSENITIYSEFHTNNQINRYFESEYEEFHIKDLDVEVDYLGGLDVAIDYIRIEEFNAHLMNRGEIDWIESDYTHDDGRGFINVHSSDTDSGWVETINDSGEVVLIFEEYLGQPNAIYNIIQSSIDALKVKTNDWQEANIFRLKYQDTENDSYYWWGAIRYCNMFSNGMFMTRDGLRDTKLYDYYTKSPNRWIEYTYGQDHSKMPAPYAYNARDDWTSMGVKWGYHGAFGINHFPDSLSSSYEIILDSSNGVNTWDDLKIDSLYRKQIEKSDVLQARFENLLKLGFHNEESRTNGFLYTGKPWYQYLLLYQYSYPDDSLTAKGYYKLRSPYKRPLTFEEYYLLNFNCIINGGKGIIVDGDQNRNLPDISSGNMGVGDHTKLNDSTDLYSNLVGDDFVNSAPDTWDAYNYLDIDTLSETMGVAPDRIYIGTKSYRDAMYQMSTFFRAVDSELMDLRLAATYSKGYGELYNQDEDMFGYENLLSMFVNLGDSSQIYSSRIKKNLFDTMLDEPFDSTFINMTLLRGDSTDIDSVFYIGIQNRRTDPLIYWTNPDSSAQKYLRFLSSAEFRDSCINSPDSLLYQDYWWKRLGARKVTIPFNYTYSDTNTYNLLRISELGSDVDSLNELWHRGENYYDMVTDTVIGQNRSLSFNLLPGQGKILKVEVLKSDTVAGFLDNYNQTKLISYEDPLIPNMIKYHLVYHRNSPMPSDTSKRYSEVQYIQSMPIAKNSQEENIVWNRASRIDLSDSLLASLPPDPNKYNYPNCNKPSIVVRDSAGIPFAYVVYTCADSNNTAGDSSRVIYAKINTVSNSISYNQQIYHSLSTNIYKYGTPVINASANGNYIAWTDNTVGLFVGFDNLSDNMINQIDTVANGYWAVPDPEPILYPSFNTYSHIDEGEDNAGLVWFQKHDLNSNIYYSRIKHETFPVNDTLFWAYEDNFENDYGYPILLQTTDKVILLSEVNEETKPIVYRSLFDYDNTPDWCIRNRIDNINWIDKDYLINQNQLKSMSLFHRDINNVNDKWSNSNITEVNYADSITSITSAQQDGISIGGQVQTIGGDFNLNLTLENASIYQEPGFFGSQIIHSDTTFGSEIGYVLNSPSFAASGDNVQLAKSPEPNTNNLNNMWKNRRVFETSEKDEYDNPVIESSANLFYKSVYDNKLLKHGLYGFSSDSNNIYFDLPVLEDETEPISSIPYSLSSEFGIVDPCATFEFSPARNSLESFSLKDVQLVDDDNDGDKEMQLTMYGHKNDDIKLFLMRNSDSTMMALTTPSTTTYPFNGTKLIYSILDSTGSTFTLIYDKQDTLARFTEKSFIGGLSTDDTVSYKSAIKNDPVKYILDFDNGANFVANNSDLLDFSVYPNPVSNTVTIQAILPETLNGNRLKNTLLELSITDITGRTILNQMVASGQVVNFDMTNYSKGAYNVKMRYTSSNQFESVRKIIKN